MDLTQYMKPQSLAPHYRIAVLLYRSLTYFDCLYKCELERSGYGEASLSNMKTVSDAGKSEHRDNFTRNDIKDGYSQSTTRILNLQGNNCQYRRCQGILT